MKRSICLFLCLLFTLLGFTSTIFANEIEKTTEDIKTTECDPFGNLLYDYPDTVVTPALAKDELSYLNNYVFLTNNVVSIENSTIDIIQKIVSSEDFELTGTVLIDNSIVDINEYYDFSEYSRYDIAAWLCNLGEISEQQKIECYCDLYLSYNFDNVSCLTTIINELVEYSSTHSVPIALSNKLQTAISPPSTTTFSENALISTIPADCISIFVTDHFTFHYNSNIPLSLVEDIGSYMESLRNEYVLKGFRTPILETNKSTLQIYISSNACGNITGSSTPVEHLNNIACPSYICLYNISENTSLSLDLKTTISHEYFHSIQMAYNRSVGWTNEAFAAWAGSTTTNNKLKYINYVKEYILSQSTFINYMYGSLIFPWTIETNYGGWNTILKIYEKLGTLDFTNLTNEQARIAINNVLVSENYSDGFNQVFRTMSSYIYNPEECYSTQFNWGVNEGPSSYITNINAVAGGIVTKTDSVPYLASDYYKIIVPSTVSLSTVKIEVAFSGTGGALQTYKEKNNNITISYSSTVSNSVLAVEKNYNQSTELGIVVTNLNNSGSLNYTVKITLMSTDEEISVGNTYRYIEREIYYNAGDYATFELTFPRSGYNLFQTFGSVNAIIELYDDTGDLLVGSSTTQGTGYGNNSFLSYYTYANTTYFVQIHLSNANLAAVSKLAIAPVSPSISTNGATLDCYEDFYNIQGQTATRTTQLMQNYVSVMTFTPTVSGEYSIEASSVSINMYLYVINPSSQWYLIENQDYNDNQCEDDENYDTDSLVTLELEAGVSYFIIYSCASVTSSVNNYSGTIQINHLT